jgi:glycosyltransferase involved in cell wall biosynthesis
MVSKAPHLLLQAHARLPADRIVVEVFGAMTAYHGDTSYGRVMAPLLRHPGVTAHGAWPHERLAEALGRLDVLVVPSVWQENSPFVIREAFAAGVPVVASRVGGIPETIVDGKNGLLFEPGSADDLHRVLSRLIEEPGLLQRLRSGIPRVRTISQDVDALREHYRELQAARP